METLLAPATILLKTGDHAQTTKLQSYFTGLFQAQDSLNEFPVHLDHVWRISYSRKDNAVASLKKNFIKGVDYQSVLQVQEREIGATTEEVYYLSVSCLEFFVVRNNREVFEVYRQALQLVRQLATKLTLPDFTNPVIAARAWADEVEARALAQHQADEANRKLISTSARVVEVQRELAVVKEEARPAVEFTEQVKASVNSLSFQEAAAALKIPGLGRTKFLRRLREEKLLTKANLPYAQYLHAGYFVTDTQTFETITRGPKITTTTRVTGKGLVYLASRLGSTLVA